MKNKNISYRSEVKATDIEAVGEIVRSTNFFNAEEIEVAKGLVEETVETGKASGYEFILPKWMVRLLDIPAMDVFLAQKLVLTYTGLLHIRITEEWE